MSANDVVPEAMGEIRDAFVEKLQESYDQPDITTIPADATYQDRPFRYQLDNLISVLADAHKEHITANKRTFPGGDVTRNALNLFIKCCTSSKDINAAKVFQRYAMDFSPRIAWWSTSSTDWIASMPLAAIDFSGFVKLAPGKTIPYLPIYIIYEEAMEMRENCETNPQTLAPVQALYCSKIAKYFYGTMQASIELLTEGTPGEEARVKQCGRKMNILKTMLEEATGEDEDFLDVLLSQFSGIGPDGQKISTKSIRKALGSAMTTGVLYDITSSIPKVMETATDAESAKAQLLEMPAMKKLMGAGAGRENIERIFSMVQGGSGFFGGGAEASSSAGTPNSNAPADASSVVTTPTRKSIAKK